MAGVVMPAAAGLLLWPGGWMPPSAGSDADAHSQQAHRLSNRPNRSERNRATITQLQGEQLKQKQSMKLLIFSAFESDACNSLQLPAAARKSVFNFVKIGVCTVF
jgi:hypothetical protein